MAADSEIQFVYFDLGNVLVQFDPQVACHNLATCFAIESKAAHRAVYGSGLQEQFERGLLTGDAFAEAVAEHLGVLTPEFVTADLLRSVSNMFTPIQAMEGVLQQVRDQGIGVGLLSNTCAAHWEWIQEQRYNVTHFDFDAMILSYEVGAMKPDEAIYEAAERAAGVPPATILFLDDRRENVEAARQRGWQAAECIGGPELLKELRHHQVSK